MHSYRIIDLRGQSLRSGLSNTLIRAMHSHLQARGQVLVYLNRRGFAHTGL